MTPAAAMTMPAREPTEARPAPDLKEPVADGPAADLLALPEPLPPLPPLPPFPPSEKPVAVALAEVAAAVPMKEEVRVQSHDELK